MTVRKLRDSHPYHIISLMATWSIVVVDHSLYIPSSLIGINNIFMNVVAEFIHTALCML